MHTVAKAQHGSLLHNTCAQVTQPHTAGAGAVQRMGKVSRVHITPQTAQACGLYAKLTQLQPVAEGLQRMCMCAADVGQGLPKWWSTAQCMQPRRQHNQGKPICSCDGAKQPRCARQSTWDASQ
jgi:hypothetical protein